MDWLVEMIRPAAEEAVARRLHTTQRDKYHDRYPVGECPLCPAHVNAMNKHRLRERLGRLIGDLGAD